MSDWKEWINEDGGSKSWSRKVNKDVFCKKNKQGGGKFGYHVYEQENNNCKLCGHIKNKRRLNYE